MLNRPHSESAVSAGFPAVRMRRLRSHPALRAMVRETHLTANDFIVPLFVRFGEHNRIPIGSMPGQYQVTVDLLKEDIAEIEELGLPAVLLFGIPEVKDETGSDALSDDGIIQQAIREIRSLSKDLLIITDLCFCEYTSHGHCGVLHTHGEKVDVHNDATLENLVKQAVSHARAGADVIAPSGMMDGMIRALRQGLDEAGFPQIPLLSYAAKYASAFYGPFRDAAESAPQFGDRRTYQMDPANGREALREVELDVIEGADMLMVKPALSYLDIIREIKNRWPEIPLAAYNVSGEYSMIKAAAARGWLDEKRSALEMLTSIKRAGADLIITYFARDAVRWLQEG